MNKIDESNSARKVNSGYEQERFKGQDLLSIGKFFSYPSFMNLAIMKFVYLLIGITGLAGTVIIILKVVRLASISNFDMVLIFVIGCLSLAVMHAGMHGFFEIRSKEDS